MIQFCNLDSAAATREYYLSNLSIYLSIYLSERENREQHGLGKVYLNLLKKYI